MRLQTQCLWSLFLTHQSPIADKMLILMLMLMLTVVVMMMVMVPECKPSGRMCLGFRNVWTGPSLYNSSYCHHHGALIVIIIICVAMKNHHKNMRTSGQEQPSSYCLLVIITITTIFVTIFFASSIDIDDTKDSRRPKGQSQLEVEDQKAPPNFWHFSLIWLS